MEHSRFFSSVNGWNLDGVWREKVNFPIIQTHDVWRWGRDDSFGLYQFSTFCLDRSLPPSLFLEKRTGKCVGEEDIVDQAGEHLTLAHGLPPNRLTQWRSSSTELRHRESFNKWGDLNPRGNK